MTRPGSRRTWLALILAGVAALLGIAGATIWLRDVIRGTIAQPFGYLAWLIGLVINSVPQSLYWIIVVAFATLLALTTLNSRRVMTPLRRRIAVTPYVPDDPGMSALGWWRYYIDHVGESAYARERISFEMRGLMIQVLAHRERQPVEEVERRIRLGGGLPLPDIPPDVQTLLLNWQSWLIEPAVPAWMRPLQPVLRQLRAETGRVFQSLRGSPPQPQSLRSDPLGSQPPSAEMVSAGIPEAADGKPRERSPEAEMYEQKVAQAIAYMESLLSSHLQEGSVVEEQNGRHTAT